jgi:hypothetical protein
VPRLFRARGWALPGKDFRRLMCCLLYFFLSWNPLCTSKREQTWNSGEVERAGRFANGHALLLLSYPKPRYRDAAF